MPRKQRTQKEIDAAAKAVRAMGGPAKAARLITHVTGDEIGKVSIFNWTKKGIPHDWADDIYSICGVPPWISNPGTFRKNGDKPVSAMTRKAQKFIDKGYKS